MQNIFYRECTRDFSLIMEEAWFAGLSEECDSVLGKNPFSPINAYYLSDGAIEVWHEVHAYEWLLNALVERSKTNPGSLKTIIEDYSASLVAHKAMWKKGVCSSREELVKYIQSVFDSMLGFIVFYYLAVDERTPKALRDFALSVREKDSFFDSADLVIRNTLKKLYPFLSGYEAGIVFEELKQNKIPSLEELKKRKQSCVLIPGSFFQAITLQEFSRTHPTFSFPLSTPLAQNVNSLKGQTAYPGKVNGIVKILRRKEQLSEVTSENVIVSTMTVPDFLPAMKKAVAFVTDEGGITCHAAIIARELKKPCIVGTKQATQVFKNGDLVEVDANKGIVKKISK